MKIATLATFLAAVLLAAGSNALAQVQVRVVGGPGGGQAFAMPFGGMGMDALAPVIAVLGDCNLAPDFNLTAEQKQKIQTVRDDFKQQSEKWRTEHAEDLKQMDEQQRALTDQLQGGNPPDPQEMMQIFEQRQQLMSTAPNGEEHASKVKDLLTPEQTKAFEARQEQLEKEREERMPIRLQVATPPHIMGNPNGDPADKDAADKEPPEKKK